MMERDVIHRAPGEPSPESWRRQTVFGHDVDVAERLPAPAREKLEKLRGELSDL